MKLIYKSLLILALLCGMMLASQKSNLRLKSFLKSRSKMKHKAHHKAQGTEVASFNAQTKTSIPPEEAVQMQEAWSSSVYCHRWWWWTWCYHAHNPLGWGLWLSKYQGHDNKEVVTWEAFLTNYNLVEALYIFWYLAPGECEIQTSPDGGTTWQIQFPMQNCKYDAIKHLGLNRWQMWRYFAFQKRYLFNIPAFTKKVRILVKDSIFGYYGMLRIAPLVRGRGYAYQFRNKMQEGEDMCMSVLNGDYHPYTSVVVQDCTDAIQNADGRELFILYSQEQRIWNLISGRCMSVDDRNQQLPQVIIDNCQGNRKDKWTVSTAGKIMSNHLQNKCLGKNKEPVQLVDLNFKAVASSSIWGGLNAPDAAITGTKESDCWKSRPGIAENNYEVTFDPISFSQFTIKWVDGFQATSYEVSIRQGNFWNVVFTNLAQNDSQDSQEESGNSQVISVTSATYSGIKIFMKDGKGRELDGTEKKLTYGIQKISIKTKIHRLSFVECAEEAEINKWELYDINWYDIQTRRQLTLETKFLMQDFLTLMKQVIQLKQFHEVVIEKMLFTAHEIKTKMYEIQANIDTLTQNYEDFKAIIKIPAVGDDLDTSPPPLNIKGVEGSSFSKSTSSCQEVKKKFPFKRSGYYWVKGQCQTQPVRLYCDFENNADYFYVGERKKSVVATTAFDGYKTVRNACQPYGLHPIEIKSLAQIAMMKAVVQEYNTQIQEQEFIPLGIDYGCSNGLCLSDFQSFNSFQSKPFGTLITPLIGKNWIQGYLREGGDSVAFDYEFKVKPLKLHHGRRIKGYICSTNFDFSEHKKKVLQITCDTVMNANTDFEGPAFTKFNVQCPSNCKKASKGKLTGNFIYNDDSSICLAGVHAGVIQDQQGGIFSISTEAGVSSYVGGSANGVNGDALTTEKPSDRSFVADRYSVQCPQGILVNGELQDPNKSSFIQTEAEIFLRNKNDNNQNKNDNNQNNNQQQQQGDQQGEGQQGGQKSDPSKSAEQDSKKEEGGQEEKQPLTTAKAIGSVVKNLQYVNVEMDSILKVTKDTQQIRDLVIKQYSPLVNSDISAKQELSDIFQLEQNIIGIDAKIKYGQNLALQKTNRMNARKTQYRIQKFKLQIWDQFQELFISEEPKDIWTIIDSKKVKQQGKSGWQYVTQKFKMPKALAQLANLKSSKDDSNTGFATYLHIDGRLYFDAVFRSSVLLPDQGSIAVLFRYIDQFNFYAFQIVKRGKVAEIRLIKMLYGQQYELASEKQGGVLQNLWYDVQIKYVKRQIEVKFGLQSPANKPDDKTFGPLDDQLPLVFEVKDGDFAQGSCGFATDGTNSGAYFARIQVKPLDCVDPNEEEVIVFVPPESSRFTLGGVTDINQAFNIIDPPEATIPSVWTVEKTYQGRKLVVMQNSLTASASQVSTLAELKLQKDMRLGVVQASVYLVEKVSGWAGAQFLVMDSQNFFALELGNDCKISRIVDGQRKFLKKNPNCKLSPKSWYRTHIKVEQSRIRVLLGTDDEDLTVIIDYEGDLPIEQGTFGLHTFKQKAAFHQIQLVPLADYTPTAGEIKYDQEQANAKAAELAALQKDDSKPDANKDADSNQSADTKSDEKSDGKPSNPLADIAEAPKEEPKPEDNSSEAKLEKEIKKEEEAAKKLPEDSPAYQEAQEKIEEQLTVEVCLTSTNVEAKEKFCKAKFMDGYAFAYEKCVSGGFFCNICCSNFIPLDDAHKTQLNDCTKQCTEVEKAAGSGSVEEGPEVAFELWQQCLKSDKESNMYNICNNKEEVNKWSCQVDTCGSCCTQISNAFGRPLDDTDVALCIQTCDAVYDPNFVPPKVPTAAPTAAPTQAPTQTPDQKNNTTPTVPPTPQPTSKPDSPIYVPPEPPIPDPSVLNCDLRFFDCVKKEGCSWNLVQFKCEEGNKGKVDEIGSKIGNGLDNLTNKAQDTIAKTSEAAQNLINKSTEKVNNVIDKAADSVNNVVNKVVDSVPAPLKNIASQVGNAANSAISSASNAASNVVNKASETVSNAASQITNTASNAVSNAKKFFGWRRIRHMHQLRHQRRLRRLRK